MSGPFFSVIVPAHNSGEFIGNCLNSINNQAFRDYELIVVCDACTDDTEALVKGWFPDKLIRTNYGMDGLARNAGIDAAEGQWILFLDDDDWWIHEFVLTEIYDVAGYFGEEIDLILFDYIWKDKGYQVVRRDEINIAVWSKAFKRELIGNTRFPAIEFTSDAPFMIRIMDKNPRCFEMRKLMYYYNYMRKGSQSWKEAKKCEGPV